jgi:hypothetical protein
MPPAQPRLSRTTPLFFALALAHFSLALLLSLLGVGWPAAPLAAPSTLITVHLLTLGFLSSLFLGALFQFVPVITARPLPLRHLPLSILLLLYGGLWLMLGGFARLDRGEAPPTLLPAGGGLVSLSFLLAALVLLPPLLRARPRRLPARLIAAGLVFLLLTASAGLGLALALAGLAALPASPSLLAAHATAGLGGWFSLTAIGASYELFPMFMLAPHERGARGEAIFLLTTGGLAVSFAGFLAGAGALRRAGLFVGGGGILLYLIDIAALYRARQRRAIELHDQVAIGAFLALALLLPLTALALSAPGEGASARLFLLAVLGWLGGLGLSQLYKIVAFLSWIAHWAPRLGQAPVPRVQDLVDERRARPLFFLYFGAVAAVVLATGHPPLLRLALTLLLAALLLLAEEYRRAWTGHYVAQRTSSPFSPLTQQGDPR